jgi:WD40 repeat protein
VDSEGTVALVDLSTGKKLRTVLGARRVYPGKTTFFSPDGRYLAVAGLVSFYLYETATGKPLHHDAGHQGVAHAVAFAPDGRTLATADRRGARLWDAATGKEVRRWSSDLVRRRATVAFTPDGKCLAHAGGATIRLWDIGTGAELPQSKAIQGTDVAFSADGRLMATMSANGPALWDVATGRNVRQFDKENTGSDALLAYSPDGKTLASVGNALYLWDAATGKRRHKIEPSSTGNRNEHASYSALAFSPDGAHVAAFGGRRHPTDTRALNVYDTGTGKQVGRFQTTQCQGCHMVLAYAPDGKTLALADVDRDIVLWEVVTGKSRARLKGHHRFVESMAFARDGKRLASASADGTALVWDLSVAAKAAPTTADACWRALAGDDATTAYDAILALVRTPEKALPLLRQHLQPVAVIEPRRLERLVADLDSKDFSTREKASNELEKLGDMAKGALRKALDTRPALEPRQRIDKLLDRLATIQVTSADLLQALRGVEVLERIGSAEARQLLRTLAGEHLVHA